ncbi:hypothetical protein A1O3_06113 [Capronia epimyces CBS 606.96]|uniref:Uncharacterized protein n=1 Tax=Capronia epimyces CBS 606.96 TaxID=1182542 RepID=W9XY35_9EURO|nr:uncharacterized protein A1O3_06113 [Capronia epimyces CBS 606.96]EXJ82300.1 hypothetical protein A1O3_06113 [Capronia epimyces CBS 606.96]
MATIPPPVPPNYASAWIVDPLASPTTFPNMPFSASIQTNTAPEEEFRPGLHMVTDDGVFDLSEANPLCHTLSGDDSSSTPSSGYQYNLAAMPIAPPAASSTSSAISSTPNSGHQNISASIALSTASSASSTISSTPNGGYQSNRAPIAPAASSASFDLSEPPRGRGLSRNDSSSTPNSSHQSISASIASPAASSASSTISSTPNSGYQNSSASIAPPAASSASSAMSGSQTPPRPRLDTVSPQEVLNRDEAPRCGCRRPKARTVNTNDGPGSASAAQPVTSGPASAQPGHPATSGLPTTIMTAFPPWYLPPLPPPPVPRRRPPTPEELDEDNRILYTFGSRGVVESVDIPADLKATSDGERYVWLDTDFMFVRLDDGMTYFVMKDTAALALLTTETELRRNRHVWPLLFGWHILSVTDPRLIRGVAKARRVLPDVVEWEFGRVCAEVLKAGMVTPYQELVMLRRFQKKKGRAVVVRVNSLGNLALPPQDGPMPPDMHPTDGVRYVAGWMTKLRLVPHLDGSNNCFFRATLIWKLGCVVGNGTQVDFNTLFDLHHDGIFFEHEMDDGAIMLPERPQLGVFDG